MAVYEPTEVEIPPISRAAAEHKILVQTGETVSETPVGNGPGGRLRKTFPTPFPPDPPVRKRYFELRPPTRGDDLPDMLRLERALQMGSLQIDLPLLREISARLRKNDFRGTAVLAEQRLLDVEPGNTEADAFAVALDIGTTTLVAMLLDLGTGSEWAVDARLNPQTRFGDDVLSRILHARQGPKELRQLQETITTAVDEMIGQLCRQAGIPPSESTKWPSPATRPCSNCCAAWIPAHWERCRLRRPPVGRSAFPPPSWDCTSTRAAART